MVKLNLIRIFYRNIDDFLLKEVIIFGWIRILRVFNVFGFIEVNDGFFFKNI